MMPTWWMKISYFLDRHGSWTLAIIVILIWLLVYCTGCVCSYYSDDRVSVWRVGLAMDSKSSKISVLCKTNSTSLRVGAIDSDADTKEVVEGVVSGVVKP